MLPLFASDGSRGAAAEAIAQCRQPRGGQTQTLGEISRHLQNYLATDPHTEEPNQTHTLWEL